MMKAKLRDLLKDFAPFPYKDFRDEMGSYEKKGEFSYVGADGELYDIRNELNNLSGKRWLYFLKSVEVSNQLHQFILIFRKSS